MWDPSVQDMYPGHSILNGVNAVLQLRYHSSAHISVCNQFIRLMTGAEITLFAPPSGSYGKASLEACAALNMKTILWSRDTIDWRDKDASLIYTRATKDIKGGEFVLMHPMEATADALGDILTYYEIHSLCAVTVSENLQNGG